MPEGREDDDPTPRPDRRRSGHRWARLPVAVLVRGPSMLPTLRPGDRLVARPARRPRPGEVVVARFAGRPDLLVVKRAIRPVPSGGWIVRGDNPDVVDDSRRYGPAQVLATVTWRYWPPAGWGRLPRPAAPGPFPGRIRRPRPGPDA